MRRKVSGLARQKHPGRLPAELEEFLSRETYSLLIKGASGSGKTILAMTILGRFRASENLLYLATRTSPHQLAKDYPWIGSVAGLSTEPKGGAAPEEGAWETLVDARLDEPGIVFERITNVLMDKHAPTVVVDSWEALSDSMEDEALRTNIRVLQTWRERAGARLIFVGEDAANTAIDSVVDGVVTLSEQMFLGRRLREIFLSKLHGVKISKPSYYFSLENGLFHSFDRYNHNDFGFAGRTPGGDLRRSGGRHHHGTGFRALDEALDGGYPSKSVSWIEMDPKVDSRVVVAFLSGTIRKWASSSGNVVLQQSEGIDPYAVAQLRASLGAGASDRLKVWGSASGRKGTKADVMTELRSKMAEAKEPTLSIVDLDKFGQSGEPMGPSALESLTDFLRGSAELSILVSRSKPGQNPISGLVSAHIRIVDINGTLFVMLEKPWSELYAMVPERQSGDSGIQLERVV
jgi:KaiC/GvpD/RAD55 family RecA-like ATPase